MADLPGSTCAPVVPGLWNGGETHTEYSTPMDLEAVESSDTRLETDIPNWALMFLIVREEVLVVVMRYNNVVGPDGFAFVSFSFRNENPFFLGGIMIRIID